MNRLNITRLLSTAALGLALAAPGPAFADGTRDKVIDIFTATLKAAGAKDLTKKDVAGDDAKFTLSGVEISGSDDDKSVEIEAITFVDAKPSPTGGITAAEVDFAGIDIADKEGGVTIGKVQIKGYVSDAPDKIMQPQALRLDRLEATEIEFSDDKIKVPLNYLLISASDYVGGIPHKGSLEMKGLSVPVNPDDPNMKPFVDLGYKELDFDASFAVDWDEKGARLALNGWTINAKDAGTVKASLALGGVTADVMKQLSALHGDNAQAMEVLQALSIESASVRIENASLFERALDAQSKQQGISKEELLHQLEASLPLMLTMLQSPAFEKKIADAVSAFLASPRSLAISATPAAPVPVTQIIGTAATAPQALPQVLGADVTANK